MQPVSAKPKDKLDVKAQLARVSHVPSKADLEEVPRLLNLPITFAVGA